MPSGSGAVRIAIAIAWEGQCEVEVPTARPDLPCPGFDGVKSIDLPARSQWEERMVKHFDHMTMVVSDLETAKKFFGLLGFKEAIAVVISGPTIDRYMGVNGMEADHVTLVLEGASPRAEIQLLRYHKPEALADPLIRDLNKIGFNHICFAVDDIEAEVARMKAAGFETRNEIMDFHSRKLVFLAGPEGITVELSQWH
jgi:catechol 2,3-dioxygenase-like lactoylglutathione lyase family enzyme